MNSIIEPIRDIMKTPCVKAKNGVTFVSDLFKRKKNSIYDDLCDDLYVKLICSWSGKNDKWVVTNSVTVILQRETLVKIGQYLERHGIMYPFDIPLEATGDLWLMHRTKLECETVLPAISGIEILREPKYTYEE